MNIDELVKQIVAEIKNRDNEFEIPVGISNRHIHLCEEDIKTLFGEEGKLKPLKNLSQPGQFACEEVVILVGPKGCIEKVRVLGPTRSKTQVEILASDCFKLGMKAPIRLSGDLRDSPGIAIVGPKGCLYLKEGVIVAKRHIHMTKEDSEKLGVHDKQIVKVKLEGDRGGIMDNVVIRVSENSKLDFHIDIDEANAFEVRDKAYIKLY